MVPLLSLGDVDAAESVIYGANKSICFSSLFFGGVKKSMFFFDFGVTN